MQKGQFSKRNRNADRNRRSQKPSVLLVALVLLLGAVVGTTIGYLFTNTDSITNTFTPSEVTVEIKEDFENNVKNNVQVKNTGDIDAYIRAAVVVTWQDKDGNVYATAPVENTDYTVTWTMTDWVKSGNYYYYTKSVAPGTSTGVLLTECKLKDGVTPPDGYHLVVEILSEAIQAEPVTAVQEAWGVTISGGNVADVESDAGGIK